MDEIKLIAGLGNPGREYEDTRHNAGFWFVDQLAAAWKIPLLEERKFSGVSGKVQTEGRTVFLLKPETFMNRSGTAVQALASFYKINPAEILVVHDELDIACGRIKLKKGGGNGGHNGLKDIQARLGTPDFYRLRLGIGHPGEKGEVIHYVLHKPGKSERKEIDDAVARAVDAVPLLLRGAFAAAQQLLHSKPEDADREKGSK